MIVYCSIPAVNRRDKTLSEIQDKICVQGVTMNYLREHDAWMVDRVRQADCIVVMHQHNEFEFTYDSLSPSVQRDVKEARFLDMKIYLAYRTSSGELNIYDTIMGTHHMKGMPGSSRAISTYLRENAPKKHVAQIGTVADNSEQREYHEQYGNTQAQRNTLADIAAELDEKVISTIDLRKFKYDRRLLI